MSVDDAPFYNLTFTNVGRKEFFEHKKSIIISKLTKNDEILIFVQIFRARSKTSKVFFCDPDDDVDDRLQYCGQTDPETGANVAGEGDKTAVFYDQDGSVTGTPETLLIDKRYTPMLTDECTFSEEYNAFVCPRKTDYVSGFHKAYKGDSEFGSGTYPDQNYFINVQDNSKQDVEPLHLRVIEHCCPVGDRVEPAFMTNTSYHITWPVSPPHEKMHWMADFLEQHDWVRISYCLQGAELVKVEHWEAFWYSHGWRDWRPAPEERQTLTEVNSIAEMDAITDRPSWYYDGEWLHIKTVGEYDIHEGGTLVDENGVTVTYAPSEHASCHKTYGCPMHTFWTNNTLGLVLLFALVEVIHW